jgi:hypothetical protein
MGSSPRDPRAARDGGAIVTATYEERIAAALAYRAAAGLPPLPGVREDDAAGSDNSPINIGDTPKTPDPAADPPDWAGSRYIRIYATTKTDPKFDDVRDDPLRWATWTWLLMDADDAWPQPARVGRHIDQAALDHLAGVGLVDLLPGDLYLMHGLDAERRARIDPAIYAGKLSVQGAVRDPSNGRWLPRQRALDLPPTGVGPAPNASWTAVQPSKSRRSSTSSSKSKSTPTAPFNNDNDAQEGAVLSWMATHGAALAPNGGKLHQRLCRLIEVHGADRVVSTFEEMAGEATEPGQFVLGASNRLNPIPGSRRAKSAGDLLPTVREAENAFERF